MSDHRNCLEPYSPTKIELGLNSNYEGVFWKLHSPMFIFGKSKNKKSILIQNLILSLKYYRINIVAFNGVSECTQYLEKFAYKSSKNLFPCSRKIFYVKDYDAREDSVYRHAISTLVQKESKPFRSFIFRFGDESPLTSQKVGNSFDENTYVELKENSRRAPFESGGFTHGKEKIQFLPFPNLK